MSFFKIFLITITFINIFSGSYSLLNSDLTNILALTANFFTNLNEHAKSNGDILSEKTEKFINNQIDHYLELVERTHGLVPKTKSRRSLSTEDIAVLSMDFIGVYILNGFSMQPRIPVHNPKDIALFKHIFGKDEIWYAVTLQSWGTKRNKEDYLIIYRYQVEQYLEIVRVPIINGVKLSAYAVHNTAYIVVLHEEISTPATVFVFDDQESLYQIQSLDVSYPSDVVIWENANEIFMAITQQMIIDANGMVTYEIQSPIFKWTGQQFDFVQHVDSMHAQKIVPFKIGNEQYLAIANHYNDEGESNIFSEIYKYNNESQQYVTYQKIFTHAAVDIKYFCFKQKEAQESFLVVGNSYEIDYDGNINFVTNSIIYKFVEDYFMPFQSFTLNYAEQWLPVVGINGEFILLVSCKYDGVKSFQYDGWRFIETEVQYTEDAFGPGVVSMQSYIQDGSPIIVVANQNDRGNMINVVKPSFHYQDIMNEIQNDIHTWCKQSLAETYLIDLKELSKRVEEAPKITDTDIIVNGKLTFQNVTVENLVLDDDKTSSRKKRQITERVGTINDPIILEGDVRVKNLKVLSDDRIIFRDEVHTKTINKVDLQHFYNDIIFLDDPFSIDDNFQFEDVIFENAINPKFINNISVNNVLFKSSDLSSEGCLIVNGNVVVDDLIVEGKFDGVQINENNILLTEGDQDLKGSIKFSEIEMDNLDVSFINNVDMKNMGEPRIIKVLNDNVESLTVKNITVGYINGLDMQTLQTMVLRTRGDQEISSTYEFDTLIVDDLEVLGLLSKTKVPDDLILTSGGTYFINQDLYFTEDLETEYLHVIKRMNHIPVFDGKMDILLKDYPGVQYISGHKTFETVNLFGRIKLRGSIEIEGRDRMSPLITQNLTLTGDYTITGNTVVNNMLKFKDLTEPSETYSMSRLEKHGLKLTDTECPVHLNFEQELIVKEIHTDTINNINVDSWIINNDEPKVITGRKIINNDLYLHEDACIPSINGQNLEQLYDRVLRKTGNQIITGNHRYKKITAVRAVSNKTYVDNVLWDNIMTLNDDQYISGTTTIKQPVKMQQLEATSMEVKGKVLNYDFNAMVADTARLHTVNEITAPLHFQHELKFNHLNVTTINGVNVTKFVSEIERWLGDIHLPGHLIIEKPVKVKNLFCNELNGLPKEDFGKVWLLKEGNQTIYGDQYIKSAKSDKLITESGLINNVNLREIDDLAVKINEEHKFNSVRFLNGVESKKPITLGGKVKGIDLKDAVLSKGAKSQTITGLKRIFNNVTVLGYLHVNGLLSGVNLTILEHFIEDNDNRNDLNLVVDGNVIFEGITNVKYLNDYNLDSVTKNTWFTDRETDFKGFVTFEDVIFEDEVQVDGYVDDVNLVWLSKNYFSKTKNQTVTAKLDFTEGVIFGKNLIAKHAFVPKDGLVGNISWDHFTSRVLTKQDQVFNFEVRFDDVEVTDQFNSKLINNLNLSTDVMRNDVFKNYVTGKKTILNVRTESLEMPKGRNLQKVNVDHWFENAVLLNGSFNIDGLTVFRDVTFKKNIDLQGLLNSHLFTEENILTTNTRQSIVGTKNFITSDGSLNSSLTIKNLKLKGLINGIDIDELMKSTIDTTKDIYFWSTKHFYNTINASNINVEKLYQGVDISMLIKNITNLNNINEYTQEYKALSNYLKQFLIGIKQQAYFLLSYKSVQIFHENTNSVLSTSQDKNETLFIKLTARSAEIYSYIWKNDTEFIQKTGYEITAETNITFASQLFFDNKWYLYLEENNMPNKDYTHTAIMYELKTDDTEKKMIHILSNGARSVTSINLHQGKNCVLLISGIGRTLDLFCTENDNRLEPHQQLQLINGTKASSLNIKNIPFIFVIDMGENLEQSGVKIWKYNENTSQFVLHESLQMFNPNSIDTVLYNGNCYVAIGLKHVVDTSNPSTVVILRYSDLKGKFEEWHRITVMDPIEVKFNVLSTNELVLHILTDCPSEPLLVYMYEGVSGFNKRISLDIPKANSISQFSLQQTNFIAVSNEYETRIFKAIYEGKKHD